jgi:hypothetical protein
LTNVYPNNNKNNNNNNKKNNKVKSKPLELFELAGKNYAFFQGIVLVLGEIYKGRPWTHIDIDEVADKAVGKELSPRRRSVD